MKTFRLLTLAAVSVVLLAVAAVAVALSEDDGQVPSQIPAPATKVLMEGTAPSGHGYKIVEIDADAGSTQFCYEISTKVSAAQTCGPIPDDQGRVDGRPVPPTRIVLGADRFFTLVAPEKIADMRITTPGSEEASPASRSVGLPGGGRLLVSMLGGSLVSSDRPEPPRAVELLDSDGHVVSEQTLTGSPTD
jgi:hypothetical protein